jgi:DNA-damage-inducible protein J
MATSNINIRTDSELKAKAQTVLSDLGLDMSTAINIYLNQVVYTQSIPFEISKINKSDRSIKAGGWEGKIRIPDNFNTPLDDFEENEDVTTVWNSIIQHAGKEFFTKTKKSFYYSVNGNILNPTHTKRNIPKSNFETALTRFPLSKVTQLSDLQGYAYIYGILTDNRIIKHF